MLGRSSASTHLLTRHRAQTIDSEIDGQHIQVQSPGDHHLPLTLTAMLRPEFFVPKAREFFHELRHHVHEEAGLLEILVQRLRISPAEDLYSSAAALERVAMRLRKIAGQHPKTICPR